MPEKVRQSVGGSCPTLFRQHAFAATNPCHVWDLARGLYGLGLLGVFHSGYPRWRLNPPLGFPLRTHSGRTLLTYGLQRLPQWVRPPDERVFRWQDVGFDREAAEHLECGEIFHGIPGQCLECFRVARRLGMVTVLNHASGPLEVQSELVRPEYERAGIPFVPEQAAPAWLPATAYRLFPTGWIPLFSTSASRCRADRFAYVLRGATVSARRSAFSLGHLSWLERWDGRPILWEPLYGRVSLLSEIIAAG